jgi:hypothetical protein
MPFAGLAELTDTLTGRPLIFNEFVSFTSPNASLL